MSSRDESAIHACITMAQQGVAVGELPYGAIVLNAEGGYLGGAHQEVKHTGDMSRHAEIVALQRAYAANGHKDLRGCTLYTSVEPCAMCAFNARLYQVSRVVFGLHSPIMGGCSHWPVLQDEALSRSELGLFEIGFAPPPEILGGVAADAVATGWREWNEIAWLAMEAGGILKI